MLPFYGDIGLLDEAVRSVLAQESPDWRLTVIDDAYPDPSAGDLVRGHGDPRVTYLRNERNVGITANFNRAIELARADRLVILGGDDRLLPGYVGHVHELAARHPDAALVQPGVRVIDDEGAEHLPLGDRMKRRYLPGGPRPVELSGEPLAASLLRGNWLYFPSIAWRRDLMAGGFREDLSVAQDLDLILRIVTAGGSAVVDDRVAFEYRRHRASLSAVRGTDGSKFAEERAVFSAAAATAERLGWRRAARAARAHTSSRLHALTELPGALARGRGRAAGRLLRHALGGLEAPGPDREARR
ncbi:MAG: glycosyltransferase [Microbacteriaceae bacterium]|nr:glycosyltransferase [Microbacteriaceae bacterium]